MDVLTASLVQDRSELSRFWHEKITEFGVSKSSVLVSVVSLEDEIEIAVSSVDSQ